MVDPVQSQYQISTIQQAQMFPRLRSYASVSAIFMALAAPVAIFTRFRRRVQLPKAYLRLLNRIMEPKFRASGLSDEEISHNLLKNVLLITSNIIEARI